MMNIINKINKTLLEEDKKVTYTWEDINKVLMWLNYSPSKIAKILTTLNAYKYKGGK